MGGGIFITGGTPLFEEVTVEQNIAAILDTSYPCHGAGLIINNIKSIVLDHVNVRRNAAYGAKSAGGGLYISESDAILFQNSIVAENIAKRGGGLFISNAVGQQC